MDTDISLEPQVKITKSSNSLSTHNKYEIVVKVLSEYLSDQSEPEDEHFVFAYHVMIENRGSLPAQLISRHWIITDGDQKVEEVMGEGVVGEKPLIPPGETFQYTSGAVIRTPVGAMHGSYRLVAADGTTFDASIPPFTLALPKFLH